MHDRNALDCSSIFDVSSLIRRHSNSNPCRDRTAVNNFCRTCVNARIAKMLDRVIYFLLLRKNWQLLLTSRVDFSSARRTFPSSSSSDLSNSSVVNSERRALLRSLIRLATAASDEVLMVGVVAVLVAPEEK